MPPVSEQFPDQRQVLAGHDGMAGHGVPKVVEPQFTQPRILAHRLPAKPKRVLSPSFGIGPEQEAVPFPLTA